MRYIYCNGRSGWRYKEARTMANDRFVAYYRVSTAKQGVSGLGLEAQQEAVRSYLNGGHWKRGAEFTEIESGKRNDRPALAEALSVCRVHGATLIIAKLDRLARNVHFISSMMEAGVEFIAVDFPQANRLTIHILAAVAEHEALMISARAKVALAAARARGVVLGGDRGNIASVAAKGAQASLKRSEEHTSELQSLRHLVCRLLLEKKTKRKYRQKNTERPHDCCAYPRASSAQ